MSKPLIDTLPDSVIIALPLGGEVVSTIFTSPFTACRGLFLAKSRESLVYVPASTWITSPSAAALTAEAMVANCQPGPAFSVAIALLRVGAPPLGDRPVAGAALTKLPTSDHLS